MADDLPADTAKKAEAPQSSAPAEGAAEAARVEAEVKNEAKLAPIGVFDKAQFLHLAIAAKPESHHWSPADLIAYAEELFAWASK